MHKKELRVHFRKKRNLLSSNSIDTYSIAIANRLLAMPIWDFSFFHIFLSIIGNKEVNTEPILATIQGKDKNVVVPKTLPDRILKHFLLTDGLLIKENSLGIPEPVKGIEIAESQLDVVFVPLLAFDRNGHRVGYGGGYYDIFLKKCLPKTLKIGLSFFDAVDKISDVAESDVPMDYCITPEKIYEF